MEYEDIFNRASYAAIKCKQFDVNKNQINQLLSILNTNADFEYTYVCMMLIAFAMRQKARKYLKGESSNAIKSTLEKIMNSKIPNITDPKEIDKRKKKDLREYLGLLKWFFEVAEKTIVEYNVKSDDAFNSLCSDFSKVKHSSHGRGQGRR